MEYSPEARQIPPRTPSIFKVDIFLCRVFSAYALHWIKQAMYYNVKMCGVRVFLYFSAILTDAMSLEDSPFKAS
jgi:hypothetical protein